jgi:hypothetical protein
MASDSVDHADPRFVACSCATASAVRSIRIALVGDAR